MPENNAITVVIPAYEEAEGIEDVVRQTHRVLADAGMAHEVVVVDDGSTDGTALGARKAGARVLQHRHNRGYGAALKTGLRHARNDIIVIVDADGTYPVDRIPDLVERLDDADMVVGARVGSNVKIPLIRRPAKWVLGRLAEYITGGAIPDLNSGLRAFRAAAAEQYITILPDTFSFTSTITVAMISEGYTVDYMPIDYHARIGQSKIVPWDFIAFVTLVLRLSMLFNPLKVFLPVAVTSFLLGAIKLTLDIVFALEESSGSFMTLLTEATVSASALIFFVSSMLFLLVGMMSDGLTRRIGQRVKQTYQSRGVHILEVPEDTVDEPRATDHDGGT